MPRKLKKTLFNFHLPKKRQSMESVEENTTDKDPRPSQETKSLTRPTRAAKQMCIKNVTNITTEEKSCNSKVLNELESDKQRDRRVKKSRKSASKLLSNESTEKRNLPSEDHQKHAIVYCENKNFGLRVKTVNKINEEYRFGKVQINSTSRPHLNQRNLVSTISEFHKSTIKEIVTLFHVHNEKLTVQKILDATKQRLHGFTCSYTSMRKILIKLGYKFKTYPVGGRFYFTCDETTKNDEQSYETEIEKSECTELITEMGRRYMGMLKPKEEQV